MDHKRYNFRLVAVALTFCGFLNLSSKAQTCTPVQPPSLLAHDWGQWAGFGTSIDHADSVAVVGTPGLPGFTMQGSVWVMRRVADGWEETGVLEPSVRVLQFGWSVALHGDLLAVGAPSLYPEDYFRGRVFLFEKQGTSWVEKAVFTAPTDEVGTSFGYAVAMSSSALVVGAPGEDNNRGNAYLIPLPLAEVPGDRKRSSGGFNDYKMLSLGDLVPHYNRSFGHSAAISGDVAVVTANYGNPVYVFESVDSSWRLADQLQPPDGHGNQYFGYSTAVDGRRIVVGNLNASATVDGAGSVHVFDDDGSSSWTETAVLGPTKGEKNDKFGWTLDVAGESIAVGTRANYAQVFHQTDQSWGPSDILKDCDEARRSFGRSLSLDHSALLVGSYGYGGGVFYPFRKEDLTATALTSQDVPRPSPKHILAFPNPSRGNLTVRLGPDQGPDARLEIFDLLGRRVHGPQLVSVGEVEVAGTQFRPGVYLVRVSRHSSSISTIWVKH